MDIDAVLQHLAAEIIWPRQYEDETACGTPTNVTSTPRRYPSREIKKKRKTRREERNSNEKRCNRTARKRSMESPAVFKMRSSEILIYTSSLSSRSAIACSLGLAFLGVALVKPKSVANLFTTIHCQQSGCEIT